MSKVFLAFMTFSDPLFYGVDAGNHSKTDQTLLSSFCPCHFSTNVFLFFFQILGGVPLPNNKYGAIVEKVKKGSAADCEGRLLPGNLQ
jgi:hypothetical protein